jgi:hypothetical protein
MFAGLVGLVFLVFLLSILFWSQVVPDALLSPGRT